MFVLNGEKAPLGIINPEILSFLIDPISIEYLANPVLLADGYVYNKKTIDMLEERSPFTRVMGFKDNGVFGSLDVNINGDLIDVYTGEPLIDPVFAYVEGRMYMTLTVRTVNRSTIKSLLSPAEHNVIAFSNVLKSQSRDILFQMSNDVRVIIVQNRLVCDILKIENQPDEEFDVEWSSRSTFYSSPNIDILMPNKHYKDFLIMSQNITLYEKSTYFNVIFTDCIIKCELQINMNYCKFIGCRIIGLTMNDQTSFHKTEFINCKVSLKLLSHEDVNELLRQNCEGLLQQGMYCELIRRGASLHSKYITLHK